MKDGRNRAKDQVIEADKKNQISKETLSGEQYQLYKIMEERDRIAHPINVAVNNNESVGDKTGRIRGKLD